MLPPSRSNASPRYVVPESESVLVAVKAVEPVTPSAEEPTFATVTSAPVAVSEAIARVAPVAP